MAEQFGEVHAAASVPVKDYFSAGMGSGTNSDGQQDLIPTGGFVQSLTQERLWFLDCLYKETPNYNVYSTQRLCGPLDVEALRAALSAVMERHEVLRSTYSDCGSAPRQFVQPAQPFDLPIIDLQEVEAAEREQDWTSQALAFGRSPFDLRSDPMLKGRLFRLAGDEHVLMLLKHHIASDGWSASLMLGELDALYNAFVEGRPSPLPPLPLQYRDFSAWQRESLHTPEMRNHLAYWQQQLSGLQPLQLPTDGQASTQSNYEGETLPFFLGRELSQNLALLARRERVTPFMLLLTAYYVLLQRYSGQEDIAIGTPTANRGRVNDEKLIGFFVNMLVMRADLSDSPTFRELLQRVRGGVIDALQHQAVPYASIISQLQPDRQIGRNPLFQVTFQTLDFGGRKLDLKGIEAELVSLPQDTAIFDLATTIHTGSENWAGLLRYSTELFSRSSAEGMIDHFRHLLQSIVANPEQTAARLPLMSAAERERLAAPRPDVVLYPREAAIVELFEQQAAAAPGSPAVFFEGETLSYEQLNRRANQLAHTLAADGVKPGDLVGFALERSPDVVVSMLAILKAGGAYVPLDVEYPPQRIAWMLEDAQCRHIISRRQIADRLLAGAAGVLCLDDAQQAQRIAAACEENPLLDSPPSAVDPAYVMFTSGSSGRPKGVVIPQRAVVRLVKNNNFADLDAGQRFVQLAPHSFDAATLEIWGPLLNGAQLFVFPPDQPSLAALAAYLREHQITYLWLTVGLFEQMVDHEPDALAQVAQVQTGGDVVSPDHVRRLLEKGGICRVSNCYGPTENTTFSTSYRVPSAAGIGPRLPIGRPINHSTAIILDGGMEPVPPGVPGELYVGGDGLALGYLNRPELTAERFVPDPFAAEPGARLYRTGDIARYLPDGSLDFLGRADQQVKIRGYRIEPGEIESRLLQFDGVRQAAVVPMDGPGGRQLVAYVVPGSAPLAPAALKDYLAHHLPAYMVPAAVVLLDELPLNPNGKLDRHALPSPAGQAAEADSAPRTAVEQRVADIWKHVLDLQEVGVSSNFFNLGGHSLLGLELFSKLDDAFGVRLPLSLLFQAPTVGALAAYIEEHDSTRMPGSVVPIKPQGSRPPLFFVHGGGGHVLMYRPLARRLHPDQPLYAIESRAAHEEFKNITSLETLAASYNAEVRATWPDGPYLLGGFSFGGFAAFEMARQLVGQGADVALLIILDTRANIMPHYFEGIPGTARLTYFSRTAAAKLQRQRRLLVQYSWPQHRERLKRLLRKAAGKKPRASASAPIGAPQATEIMREMMAAHRTLVRAYVPGPYDGRIVLFRSDINSSGIHYGWHELALGGVDQIEIPGDHLGITQEPNVRLLAEALEARIQALHL